MITDNIITLSSSKVLFDFMWVILLLCTGVCETGYKGDNCDQCDTGYYGDGATCTTCGTHKTTPESGTAATEADCKFTLLSKSV